MDKSAEWFAITGAVILDGHCNLWNKNCMYHFCSAHNPRSGICPRWAKSTTDMDMAELWDWLYIHPKFYCETKCCEALLSHLSIEYVKVNPETDEVDDDPTKNTQVQCWLEFGPWEYLDGETYGDWQDVSEDDRWVPTHDIDLDCGGDTFEEAFRELCSLVLKHYGDYER